MKKNLLSVLILALMIVNVAISVITMISITGTNKKTAALVDTIATVLNLELRVQASRLQIPRSIPSQIR